MNGSKGTLTHSLHVWHRKNEVVTITLKCHNFYQLGPSNKPSHDVVENGFFSVKCIRADESLLFEVLVPFTNGIKKHVCTGEDKVDLKETK